MACFENSFEPIDRGPVVGQECRWVEEADSR